MSYSLGQTGTLDEVLKQLAESAGAQYPEETAAFGVREQIDKSMEVVTQLLNHIDDGGRYSVTLTGHVHQGEGDSRSWAGISINAASPIT